MLQIPHLQKDIILAPFTTYKIGGPADFYVPVKTEAELVQAVKTAQKENIPYFILGTGANILITDKGFRGLVIHNQYQDFEFLPGNVLRAGSGAEIGKLIIHSLARGLSGLEHFIGIPSSVGGAVWQNLHFLSPDRAGTAFIESVILGAKILDDQGEINNVDNNFFEFGYDDSILHHRNILVLEVTFKLSSKPKAEIRKQMTENLTWRVEKQPQLWNYPSCGSVFKKIKGAGAGRLIDQAGLKGAQIGGAQVSPKHANYIINTGNAKAADILSLIEKIQKEVKEKTGFKLEPEIGIVGEK